MNIFEIKGGLGNQLFQYAFSRYIEIITGISSLLWVDFFDYCKDMGGTVREYSLDKFNIPAITMKGRFAYSALIDEESFSDDTPVKDTSFFRGFWQNKRYFEAVKDDLVNELVPKPELISPQATSLAKEILACPSSVALHIRRQDYLNS